MHTTYINHQFPRNSWTLPAYIWVDFATSVVKGSNHSVTGEIQVSGPCFTHSRLVGTAYQDGQLDGLVLDALV